MHYFIIHITPPASLNATPHKEHLTFLHEICLRIFRDLAQKSLDIRQYAYGISMQSDEKSDCTSSAQALCGVALNLCCYYIIKQL